MVGGCGRAEDEGGKRLRAGRWCGVVWVVSVGGGWWQGRRKGGWCGGVGGAGWEWVMGEKKGGGGRRWRVFGSVWRCVCACVCVGVPTQLWVIQSRTHLRGLYRFSISPTCSLRIDNEATWKTLKRGSGLFARGELRKATKQSQPMSRKKARQQAALSNSESARRHPHCSKARRKTSTERKGQASTNEWLLQGAQHSLWHTPGPVVRIVLFD